MLFPILFGHMTFASHRCWTVFVKKGVYLAFEARRRAWGDTVRQGAKEAGGGELIHHIRQGLPPCPLVGWRRRRVEGDLELLEGPNGETCATTAEAMSTMLAAQAQRSDAAGNSNAALRWIHEFLTKEYGCIKTERLETTDGAPASLEADDATRVVVTTSSLEDWLWRGDDPIVKDMSWYVYSMWVYRVELPPTARDAKPRHVTIEFSPDYKLHHTHAQRLATEFRVPLF